MTREDSSPWAGHEASHLLLKEGKKFSKDKPVTCSKSMLLTSPPLGPWKGLLFYKFPGSEFPVWEKMVALKGVIFSIFSLFHFQPLMINECASHKGQFLPIILDQVSFYTLSPWVSWPTLQLPSITEYAWIFIPKPWRWRLMFLQNVGIHQHYMIAQPRRSHLNCHYCENLKTCTKYICWKILEYISYFWLVKVYACLLLRNDAFRTVNCTILVKVLAHLICRTHSM